MLLVQKWLFFQLFFLGNTGLENVFYDIVERKNAFLGYKNNKFKSRKIDIFPKAFLGYKNNKFKSRKIDIFPKGLTHGFGPEMASFPTFSFLAIQARKMSFTIF